MPIAHRRLALSIFHGCGLVLCLANCHGQSSLSKPADEHTLQPETGIHSNESWGEADSSQGDTGPTHGMTDSGLDAFGKYMDGVYRCCEAEAGVDCCESSEAGKCFQFGGAYGHCISLGNQFQAKVICAKCCSGLIATEPLLLTDKPYDGYAPGCGPSGAPDGTLECIPCGNGTCDTDIENHCNCPSDCP
jgi:hypothetical protein